MDIDSLQTGPLEVNTYIVPLAGQAVLIVDPAACSYSGDEKSIVEYLDEHDLVPIGVLLTHGHFDHVCGLKPLRAAYPKIPVAINKGDADCIGENSAFTQGNSLDELEFDREDELHENLANLPAADFLVEDGDTLDKFFAPEYVLSAFTGDKAPDVEACLNELSHWKILHTSGHSAGSVCYYNASQGVLISGDTVFYQSYGRTDLRGGSEAEIKESLVRLFEELPSETLVYPGHGTYGFELSVNE